MKNYLIIPALTVILFSACKGKKDSQDEAPISAISIIKGQLNKLDSSMYAFSKFEKNDNKIDSAYLKREEVRKFAEPFLSLPDIADKKIYKKYTEERLIDAQQGTLSIISTLKEGENSEVQRQIMIIGMDDVSSGKVKSIFIDRSIISGDSTIEQKLFWELDKFFTVDNLVQKDNQNEKYRYTKIAWQ